ncbi:hypothetical protein COCON_G00053690 [Conger conger]|uniref:Uncharacterized protein n=1 Tax=Conger conger TaxID=82655 RepID=A0A9Q1DVX6_CONCO|nr:hypothetical protein COCON_G00053690 [Conger conger]
MAEVRRARQLGSGNMEGGLLVEVSVEDGVSSSNKFNCTVAAAGRWGFGVTAEAIKQEVVKRLPSSVALSSPVDPEELSIFSEIWGPLRFLLSIQVEIHFILKLNETVSQQVFRCPLSAGPGPQCGRLHPVAGGALPLLLPPEVAETGLCGDTVLLPLAALGPCVEQDGGPSAFPARLGGLLAWEEFGLSGVRLEERPCTEGAVHAEVVYTLDSEQSPTTEQTLILFLFIQHSDPFHSQLSDYIASEEALEQHLDQILLHNEDRMRSALHSVLKSALATSSSLEFRTACLHQMKVRDTHELAIRLRQSLQKVTEGRFLQSRRCDNSKQCLSACPGEEDVSGHREAETRVTDEQNWECAELSRPNEEVVPQGPPGPAGLVSRAGKRQCAGEPDSNPPPLKLHVRGPGRALQPPERLHRPPGHTAPHHRTGDPEEDMLWLQEISNMSDWE